MTKGYPNLELLEYKFRQELQKREPNKFREEYVCNIFAEVFPQTWASTALGFGGVGGSAMTIAYTTVFHAFFKSRSLTETNVVNPDPEAHAVFFDGRFAYLLTGDPNPKFFDDINNRKMASVEVARARYCDDE